MKIPRYSLTNLILKYIVKYELSVCNLTHTELPRDFQKPLLEKFYAEEIDNIAQIVAFPIGYNTALKILRGQEHTTGKSKKKVFSCYRNTKDYIKKYNNSTAIKPSMDLAIHLNKLITKGWLDDWDQGRIKTFSEKPDELFDTWYSLRDYYPSTNMKTYFNDIFKWITQNEDNTHKLIQFAILLYEFIDKAPFYAGNQMTTILTVELLAKEYGYNPNAVIPYAKAINFISEDLKSAFKISKGKNDLTTFIEALLYTFSLTAIETTKEYTTLYKEKILKYPNITEELNSRQLKIIEYLEDNKRAYRKELTDIMGVSFMTVFRDLHELIEKGYVIQEGRGRGTHYQIKHKSQTNLSEISNDIKIY